MRHLGEMEAAAEKHMAQLQHNMLVAGTLNTAAKVSREVFFLVAP